MDFPAEISGYIYEIGSSVADASHVADLFRWIWNEVVAAGQTLQDVRNKLESISELISSDDVSTSLYNKYFYMLDTNNTLLSAQQDIENKMQDILYNYGDVVNPSGDLGNPVVIAGILVAGAAVVALAYILISHLTNVYNHNQDLNQFQSLIQKVSSGNMTPDEATGFYNTLTGKTGASQYMPMIITGGIILGVVFIAKFFFEN